MPESVIAAVATMLCAIGLKLFETWINGRARRKAKKRLKEEEVSQRDAVEVARLRDEILRLQEVIETTEAEMLQWREKYWALREKYVRELARITKKIEDVGGQDE